MAFDIQVFISERAQDLAPEQSRQLLGQLQQLQRAFHRAAGRAQARADALSAQREREEEWRRRERAKEDEERERQSAREREVWEIMIESDWFETLVLLLANRRRAVYILDFTALRVIALLSHTLTSSENHAEMF